MPDALTVFNGHGLVAYRGHQKGSLVKYSLLSIPGPSVLLGDGSGGSLGNGGRHCICRRFNPIIPIEEVRQPSLLVVQTELAAAKADLALARCQLLSTDGKAASKFILSSSFRGFLVFAPQSSHRSLPCNVAELMDEVQRLRLGELTSPPTSSVSREAAGRTASFHGIPDRVRMTMEHGVHREASVALAMAQVGVDVELTDLEGFPPGEGAVDYADLIGQFDVATDTVVEEVPADAAL